MFERKNHFGFYALFFFLGGLIGAGAGLLFAPTTGRKLQKQLKDVIDDQVDNVHTVVHKVVNA
ncbi:MAG TPA: YtxH domain-containing protein [Thermoanaerobaculia bacterium]